MYVKIHKNTYLETVVIQQKSMT